MVNDHNHDDKDVAATGEGPRCLDLLELCPYVCSGSGPTHESLAFQLPQSAYSEKPALGRWLP